MTSQFTGLDYTIFGAYLVATASIGLMAGGKGKTLSNYFLADRGVNRYVVAMTVLASLFSGISYIATPAELYVNGIGFSLVMLSFFISTPFVAIWLMPFFHQARYFTAYQFFEERFGAGVRLMASGLFILRASLWLGGAIFAPALAIEAVTGMPLAFTIFTTGIISTLYTMKGGMKAVIWTDVMQLGVLFGGQLLIMLIAAGKVDGGIAGIWNAAKEGGKLDLNFSLDPQARMTVWAALIGGSFLNLVQMATDQVSVQRYLTAGSLREAQKALWIKLWMFVPVFLIFMGTGFVLYAFYQQNGDPLAAKHISKPDQILPYFVITQLPSGLPGLLVAAIFAASMSTVSAGVNSLTSATLCDFYQTLERHPAPEEVQVRRARWWTLIYGLLVTLFAFVISQFQTNLVESINVIMGVIGGPMVGLFFLGMFTRKADMRGAIIGTLVGFAVSAFLAFFKYSPDPGKNPIPLVSFLWLTLIATFVTMAVGLITSGRSAKPSVPHQ